MFVPKGSCVANGELTTNSLHRTAHVRLVDLKPRLLPRLRRWVVRARLRNRFTRSLGRIDLLFVARATRSSGAIGWVWLDPHPAISVQHPRSTHIDFLPHPHSGGIFGLRWRERRRSNRLLSPVRFAGVKRLEPRVDRVQCGQRFGSCAKRVARSLRLAVRLSETRSTRNAGLRTTTPPL